MTSEFPRPVNREFSQTVADLVMDTYEVAHSRIHGRQMRPTENATAGIFTYQHNDFTDTIEVMGESFKWSANGNLISVPAKSWGEWIEFINAMMVLFNRSLLARVA